MNPLLAGLAALTFLSVAAFGGVEPSGQATLELGSALLFALWGVRAFRARRVEIRACPLYAPLLGLGAIGFLQLGLGLTASPYATKIGLLQWTADLLLVFVFVESCRTSREVRGFLWFLAALGFAVALFGIVQHFTGNGKLYWSLARSRFGAAVPSPAPAV